MDLLGDITLLKASRVSSCFFSACDGAAPRCYGTEEWTRKAWVSKSRQHKIMAALRRMTESVELISNSWCILIFFFFFTSCWPMPCSWSYFPSFRLRMDRISLSHQNNPIMRRGAGGITVNPLIWLPAGGSGDDEPHCSPYLSPSLSLFRTQTRTHNTINYNGWGCRSLRYWHGSISPEMQTTEYIKWKKKTKHSGGLQGGVGKKTKKNK